MNKQILYVDAGDHRLWYARALRRWSYQVVLTADITEAYGQYANVTDKPYDAIVCDADVGSKGNGYRFLAEIRQGDKRMPLLLHTARPKSDFPDLEELGIAYQQKSMALDLVNAVNALFT